VPQKQNILKTEVSVWLLETTVQLSEVVF